MTFSFVRSARRLEELVANDAWLMGVLRAVRTLDLPNWVVGAGVIRNLVWDHLHGLPRTPPKDVDVAFFDAGDVTRARDRALEVQLSALDAAVPWEVTNQAGVHLWYERRFGASIRPITSIEDAISRWPETATAVGVTLGAAGDLDVIAPYGLDDLLGMVLRRNPKQVTRAYFLERAERKRIAERWPHVAILDE